MSDPTPETPQAAKASVWNLPNQLTAARLLLSVVLFVLLGLGYYWVSFWLFIIAAGTDWFDGYFARKYNLVTKLGRILDPFADKTIICGTYIFLAATPGMIAGPWYYCLKPWMVVVVVGREMLVTMLRSLIEGSGGDFSAKMSGKIKMVAQCVVAPAVLFYLAHDYGATGGPVPLWVLIIMAGSIWLTLLTTVYSGAKYVIRAIEIEREST